MKRILVLDGGGAKSLISITVLCHIAEETKKNICELFDLIVATSIGAIEGGMLSTGVVTTVQMRDIIYTSLPSIFNRRFRIPILQPLYSRKPIENILKDYIDDYRMKQCKTKFMATSINIVNGRTHYFKSWEQKDRELLLSDVILRSAAVPLYFGKIVDKLTHSVWIDGKCGIASAPIMDAFIESMRQGWLLKEHVHIVSLGCGQATQGVPYDEAKHFKNIQQVDYLLQISKDGLSKIQVNRTQDEWIKNISKYSMDLSFQRVEKYDLPKELDKMDNVENRLQYIMIGEELAKSIDYKFLKP